MRLAKSSAAIVAALALLAWATPPGWAQTQPPSKTAPAKQAGKAPGATAAPAKTQAAKPPAKAPAKKPAKKKAPAAAPKVRPAAIVQRAPARRDPFNPLLSRSGGGSSVPERLPPGKAGLIISTLRVDGLVRAPNGMIAVVSNPQQRVYFLHEGDQLYDGRVEHITMEAVAFHEVGKDAFGKPIERQVIKRLYPSSGE